jgi:hypothetical protein
MIEILTSLFDEGSDIVRRKNNAKKDKVYEARQTKERAKYS